MGGGWGRGNVGEAGRSRAPWWSSSELGSLGLFDFAEEEEGAEEGAEERGGRREGGS